MNLSLLLQSPSFLMYAWEQSFRTSPSSMFVRLSNVRTGIEVEIEVSAERASD